MSNKRKVFSTRFFIYLAVSVILLAAAITFGILGSPVLLAVLGLSAVLVGVSTILEYRHSKNSPALQLQNKLNELNDIHPNKNEGGKFFVPNTYTHENISTLFSEINRLIPKADDESLNELISQYFLVLTCLKNSINSESFDSLEQDRQVLFLNQFNNTFSISVEYCLKTKINLEKALNTATGFIETFNLFTQPFFVSKDPESKLFQLIPIERIATAMTKMIVHELEINSHSTQIKKLMDETMKLFTSFNQTAFNDCMSVALNNQSSANSNITEAIKTQFASAQNVVAKQLEILTEQKKILASKKEQPQEPPVVAPKPQLPATKKQPDAIKQPSSGQKIVAEPLGKSTQRQPEPTRKTEKITEPRVKEEETEAFHPTVFVTKKMTAQNADNLPEEWKKMELYLKRSWDFPVIATADGFFVKCRTQTTTDFWRKRINEKLGGNLVDSAMLDDCPGFLFKTENFAEILRRANPQPNRFSCSIL